MGCGQKMLKGHLTMLLTIPSKTINFFQCPAPPFKELNFSLTTDPQPLTSFTHDPEWRISVTVWRPQYRTGLVCSGLVLGHHMLYVLSKLLYYIPIVCTSESWTPHNYFLTFIVCLVADDSVSGDRIRDLEYQLSSQQENFAARMRDMEAVIRRQEELLAHVKVNGEC